MGKYNHIRLQPQPYSMKTEQIRIFLGKISRLLLGHDVCRPLITGGFMIHTSCQLIFDSCLVVDTTCFSFLTCFSSKFVSALLTFNIRAFVGLVYIPIPIDLYPQIGCKQTNWYWIEFYIPIPMSALLICIPIFGHSSLLGHKSRLLKYNQNRGHGFLLGINTYAPMLHQWWSISSFEMIMRIYI